MFRWLTELVNPHYEFDDLIEEIVPGHRDRMARLDEKHDAAEARELKKARFEQELEDADWILAYEKRLAKLQAKTAAQRSKASQAGVNTDRLRKLEHHLAGLRRSLD